MTRIISQDDMANVRQSLAQAGIFFDKLYINQAYFNSHFTIQTSNDKPKKSNHHNFLRKLLCGSKRKQSTIATQTALTVRDDSEIKPCSNSRRQRVVLPENTYDRRRYRPLNREFAHSNYQQSIRRRRSSIVTRSVQIPKQDVDDDSDEFAV